MKIFGKGGRGRLWYMVVAVVVVPVVRAAWRLGMQRKGIREVKEHPWFREIDFIKLERKKLAPPYRPDVVEEAGAARYYDRYDDAEDSSAAPFTSGTWDDCF